MQSVNVIDHIDDIKENESMNAEMHHHPASYDEVSKISMESEFKTREHEFDNGISQVMDEITIKIKFNNAIVQPHVDFDSMLEEKIIDYLCEEMDGLLENQQ